MSKKAIKILAIESSCDETAVAIVEATCNKRHVTCINILSNIVSSQIKLHAKYGGVYPELASREHIKNIIPIIEQALSHKVISHKENTKKLTAYNLQLMADIDYIAVTTGPGLIGSLLVGVETAKTLAYVFDKPIIPVNHLEGHIYSNFVRENVKLKTQRAKQQLKAKSYQLPAFPLICLIVSGGHTSLIYMKNRLNYKIIGETLDDAAGEAFDKVAAMLGLGYPGGPEVERMAKKCKAQNAKSKTTVQNLKIKFPRPMIESKDFNFSFSGLKTAVLYVIKKLPKPLTSSVKSLICHEFQNAVVETLVAKTLRAAEKYKVKSILLGGGVAANSLLRKEFELKTKNEKLKTNFFVPPKKLCTDNAAAIGAAATYKILADKISTWDKIKADANLEL